MQVTFQTEADAIAVEQYLRNVIRVDKLLVHDDEVAISTAIELAEVSPVIQEPGILYPSCKLLFPVRERQCGKSNHPRIFVRCIAAYNHGFLHGMWIDATQEAEEIKDDIEWMLSWSPVRNIEDCEEWRIDDWDCFYGCIDEWSTLADISDIGKAILEVEEEDRSAIAIFLQRVKESVTFPDMREWAEKFQDYYCGVFDNEERFAIESEEIEERYEYNSLSRFWKNHIDWESVGREVFMDDYWSSPAKPYGIHVFRSID